MYELEFMNKKIKVEAFKTNYITNDNLAVVLENKDFQEDLTVNLVDYPTNKDCAFIDTNNVKWAEKFLQENKIAQPTGRYGMSGFCTYPEYRFDLSKLKDYENEGGSQDKENEDEM